MFGKDANGRTRSEKNHFSTRMNNSKEIHRVWLWSVWMDKWNGCSMFVWGSSVLTKVSLEIHDVVDFMFVHLQFLLKTTFQSM